MDLGWVAEPLLGGEQVVVSLTAGGAAAADSRLPAGTRRRSLSPGAPGVARSPSITPKKVFARLCKNNPYIGFFHYAPG